MIVQKTSIFPAGRDAVFQKLRPLQYIAEPYPALANTVILCIN